MIEKYYCVMGKLAETYNLEARKYKLKARNKEELNKWKKELKSKLKELLGIKNIEKNDLKPKFIEIEELEGYRREKVILETETNVFMPMYVLIPSDLRKGEKRPCIIATHGHGCAAKDSTAGRIEIPAVKKSIDQYNCDYGLKLVKEGYIVFCNDARGFGERREWMNQGDSEEDLIKNSCNAINNAAISLGKTLLGMMVWDLIRIVDYIETLDYCDEKNIGCIGFSGGGLQAIWLAALEGRIKAAYVSGYFHSFKDALMKTNFCGCNFVPGLWKVIEMGDLGALVSPKALLIESGTKDPLNGERGMVDVQEQLGITKTAYSILNNENKLYHHIFDGVHVFNGGKMRGFFKEYLK